MSVTYSAGVFFGVAVAERTRTARALNVYIDRHGGTPAPTEHPGVEVTRIGNDPVWIVVRAKGSHMSFSTDDLKPVPEMLEEGPGWHEALAAFLAPFGTAATIGWRFYGQVV